MDHALLVYYDIIGTAGLGGRREPPGYGCMRVINGSQYFWTLALEDKIPASQTKGVVEYKAQALAQIDDLINLVRGKMTKQQRMKVGALIVIEVHARDVVDRLIGAEVAAVNDFDWVAQMRYY